ncbi:MAG: ABC-2 family transporter protein [Kofleriaceae bacterium]
MTKRSSTLSRTVRALPTLLRVGVAETVAYRAEFIVWILTTTQPLIMMSLWTSVAHGGSFKGYDADAFIAYYLATLLVRQLTGNWVAWQMMEEIRMGTMAMRLLRPIHPFVTYMASHLAALPFRSIIAAPLVVILLITSASGGITHDAVQLSVLPLAIAMAWLITFAILFAIGALAFFLTQTTAISTLYFGLFSLFSGYLLPLDLLPAPIAKVAAVLPFRFTLAMPVELITHTLPHAQLAHLLAAQAAWTAGLVAFAVWIWNAGVRRFEAVGT